MSSSVFVAQLGLVPSSTCSHGAAAAQGTTTTTTGNDECYPYNSMAAFVVDRILFHFCIRDDPNLLPAPILVFQELVTTPEHVSRIDANFVKSCVMVGTDIMHGFAGMSKKKEDVAINLAIIIVHIEEYLRLQDGLFVLNDKMFSLLMCKAGMRVMNLDMDCTRKILLFYDSRNPCSCLDQAKEQHKIVVGRCMNPGCGKVTLDAKLLTCGGCDIVKVCCRECHLAYWPEHKGFCKIIQKERKQAKNNK